MFQSCHLLRFLKPQQCYVSTICLAEDGVCPVPPPCPEATRLTCVPDPFALMPGTPQPKVVIIGAGMAGLSAAERLITCGLDNVVVLEALDRPGGRIYTKKIGETTIDLGAGWINGPIPANPVFGLACLEGAISSPITRVERYVHNFFDSSSQPIKSKVYVAATQFFDDIKRSALSKYGKGSDSDLKSYFAMKIKEKTELFPETDRDAASKVMFGLTNDIKNDLGTDMENIRLNEYGKAKIFPGGKVTVEAGMARVLNPLLNVITDKRIKYNKIVNKIKWIRTNPKQPRVIIVTKDGQTEDADYVVVALPLGVLQHDHANLFDPRLPEKKIISFCKLGYGFLTTLVFKYEKPFWIKGEGYIRLSWSEKELQERNHWTKGVSLIEEIPPSKDLLHLRVSGAEALQVECLPDCQVIDDVMMLIRKFIGDSSLPRPSELYRNSWSNNNLFRGSVSYVGKNARQVDTLALATPVPDLGNEKAPILFFAGEGCCLGLEGTLGGARLSGIRVAEKILTFTKRFSGPPPQPIRPYL